MPRAVPSDTARRRRDRLSELIDALGAARGERVTQREFAGSIGREQGTIAAILGGHRALGGDVMMAVVQAYRLPSDYFDSPLRPDPRSYARAMVGDAPAMSANAQAIHSNAQAIRPIARETHDEASARGARPSTLSVVGDPALAEAVASLQPERSVAMALDAIARRGVALDVDAWVRLAIGAQSAQDRGVLVEWFDSHLASLMGAAQSDEIAALPMTSISESSSENVRVQGLRRR